MKNQGDRIEFDCLTYNASYFDLTDIDLNFFEATLGPSFNLKRCGIEKSRFYVYGIGDEVLLGNDQYFAARRRRPPLLELCRAAERRSMLRLETRLRHFTNTDDRPTNTLRDGEQTTVRRHLLLLSRAGLVLIVAGLRSA